MNHNKKLTGYVSRIDQFLYEFDKHHHLTASQRQERNGAERIAALRDGTNTVKSAQKNKLWEGF